MIEKEYIVERDVNLGEMIRVAWRSDEMKVIFRESTQPRESPMLVFWYMT